MEEQTIEIKTKTLQAKAELAIAKPALAEAKKAVTGIQKKYDSFLCDFALMEGIWMKLRISGDLLRPFAAVSKLFAFFSVPPSHFFPPFCHLTLVSGAEKKLAWSQILQKFTQRDFIPSIINFKNGNITEKIRHMVQSNYLSQPEFTFENVRGLSLSFISFFPPSFSLLLDRECLESMWSSLQMAPCSCELFRDKESRETSQTENRRTVR